MRLALILFSLILLVIGFIMIWRLDGVYDAIGVMVILWGNNTNLDCQKVE